MPTRSRPRLAALAAALPAVMLTASCSRDLSIPAPSDAPVVDSFSPSRGYQYDVVTFHGRNFDPVAANNEVHFGPYSNFAFDSDGGTLDVHVPEGLTFAENVFVSTPAGRSPLGACYDYRGYGHPFRGTSVADIAILHRSPGLAAAGGDLLIASTLFDALLGRAGVKWRFAQRPLALAATEGGAAVLVGLEGAGAALLDPKTGTSLAAAALGGASVRLVAAGSGAGAHFAIGTDASGGTLAWSLSPADLTAQTRKLDVIAASAIAAAPDGQTLLLAGTHSVSGHAASGALFTAPAQPAVSDLWVNTPGTALPTSVAAFTLGGAPKAVLGFDDGSVAVLALDTHVFSGAIAAGSTTPVSSVAAVARGADVTLIASKPFENAVVGLDAATGAQLWISQLGGHPGALAVEPDGSLVHASDLASNFADAIDPLTGAWRGRTSYLTGVGSAADCDCGPVADYVPVVNPDPCNNSDHPAFPNRILMVARRLHQLLALDPNTLETSRAEVLASGTSPARGLLRQPDGTVWVLHESELGTVDHLTETVVVSGLPYAPTRLAFTADGTVLVGSLQDVTVTKGGAILGGMHLPGPLALLQTQPDGRVLVLWSVAASGEDQAGGGLFTVAALTSGGTPAAPVPAAAGLHGFLGAISMLDGPLLFFRDEDTLHTTAAATLDPAALAFTAAMASPVVESGPLITSPDGRFFLWTHQTTPDHVLHESDHYEYYPTVEEFGSYQLQEQMAMPLIDPSGEWIYVPEPDVDHIAVFQ